MKTETRQSTLLIAAGIWCLASSALIESMWPSLGVPIHALFLALGVAVASYGGGWRMAVVAIVLALICLQVNDDATLSHELIHLTEWTAAAVLTLRMRAGIKRARASESKLRALLASMDDLILILGRDGTYQEVVPTNPSPLYRPVDEMIGRRISDVFPKHEADLFLAHIERALAERKTVNIDYSLPIGDRQVWFSAAISPLNESAVIWVARDITSRKTAEEALEQRVQERTRELSQTIEALHQSEERFRLLASATSDAVWDLDLATGRVWRGSGYETLFGYREGDIAPTVAAWIDLIHPDDREALCFSYTEAIESGAVSWSQEYRFRRADGSYANILDSARIVRDSQTRPVRVVGSMVDITERKQLQQELEQARRVTSLGRVAASIAHEVNNVLMGIQPNAEVIHRKGPLGLRHVSENIMQAVRRGKRVTEEILRFTRPAEPTLQCLEVGRLVEQWAEEIRPMLGPSIDLTISAGSDHIYALADPLQVGQVLTNLAINARDAMADRGGTLTISAEVARSWGSFRFGVVKSPDRFVHLTISDEGCGISESQLAHIFEPLFTTKKGGIGLGLAITYQVVSRHGGHIFVESEVGKGSTFHLFLPSTLPVMEEMERKARPSLNIRRLLLVEDDAVVSDGIATLMQLEGFDVKTVSTGGEAAGAIERFSPEAVLLDIGLPDMDGVSVYLDIHSRWPDLPVLFSTGHGDSAMLETYLARPNVGFILKPYDLKAIQTSLAEIMQRPAVAV